MQLSTLLLTLPALAVAADQVPLKEKASGWLNKAKSYVDSARPVAQGPINDAAASAVTARRVHKFTHANYDAKLSPTSQNPADGPENWLVLATGGNKTCFGRCEAVDRAWNLSVPLISATPNPPNFGIIDCERQPLLCTTWAANVPSLWLFQVPIVAPGEPRPRTPLYIKSLSTNKTTADDILSFYVKNEYTTTVTDEKTGVTREKYRYDGVWHPINGELKVYGLMGPVGYVLWGFSQIPSFVFMILISFVSRNIMSRRSARGGMTAPPPGSAPPAAAPAGTKKSN